MSKRYKIKLKDKVHIVNVDRSGKVKHAPFFFARFYGKPFDDLKKWCLLRFTICSFEEVL